MSTIKAENIASYAYYFPIKNPVIASNDACPDSLLGLDFFFDGGVASFDRFVV